MRIIVDVNKEYIIEKLQFFTKRVFSFLYQWITTDGEVVGYILGFMHVFTSILVLVCILICHTIYPVFWVQCVVYSWLLAIWIQHVVLNVCIITLVEKDFTQKDSPFYLILGDILKLLNIDVYQVLNYIVVAETVAIACFGLEIVSKICEFLLHT
jgi:hypothetical protein